MKTKTKSLSKGAQNYINSLVEQGKLFTVSTISQWFPEDTEENIMAFIAEAVKGQGYSTISDSAVFVPGAMFAHNAAKKSNPVKIKARMSTVSSFKQVNVPLSSTVIENFGLSMRRYRYSIKGNTITIHRSSTNTKLLSFIVWKTKKAMIPTPTTGEYTVVVK
jgi:hypothetical protein